MSGTTWEALRERLASDVALRDELTRCLTEGGRQHVSMSALVEFGKAHGCDFAEGDLLVTSELTDQQLDQVAGGSGSQTFERAHGYTGGPQGAGPGAGRCVVGGASHRL